MTARLTIASGAALLLAGCAASPDYGYSYGYAANDYGYAGCGWGGPCYGSDYGPSLSFGLGFDRGDHDRGDRDRRAFRGGDRDRARSGSGGEHRTAEAGRGGRSGPQHHQGGEHGHDHDHDH
jgi:hypothetical protein